MLYYSMIGKINFHYKGLSYIVETNYLMKNLTY